MSDYEVLDYGAEGTTKTMSLQAGLNFTLLRTKLVAVVEKKGEEFNILLMPTEKESDRGMKIGEIIDDIKALGGNVAPEDIKGQLDIVAGSGDKPKTVDINKVEFFLQQAFFYYNKKKVGEVAQTTLEYAFCIRAGLKGVLDGNIGFVNLDSAYVAVYNTDRQKILERMKLLSIDQLLEQTS